jgi:hypothetical protein
MDTSTRTTDTSTSTGAIHTATTTGDHGICLP